MMSFCKKSVHSLLGFSIPMNLDSESDPKIRSTGRCYSAPPFDFRGGGVGIGLIGATGESWRTPNVVESAAVVNRSFSLPAPPKKRDPGGVGFIDDIGGGVDGLMSCTESLGFESSDERRVDDEIDLCCANSESRVSDMKKASGRRREVRRFPPPLSSLDRSGRSSFFLRPVRKNGRLELTEVRIHRPEILRASREDGRLRLHLVRDERSESDDSVEEETEEENEGEQEDEITEDMEEVVERRSEEWRIAVAGEGMRCHEAVAHQRDYHRSRHNQHIWSQHCVTTS